MLQVVVISSETIPGEYLSVLPMVVIGAATGSREKNLVLSQKRADAVTEMLTELFRVDKTRLVSLGLGEENLFDQQNGKDGVNRRVELFNIGPR
jgi:hypothetical protein